MMEKPSFIIKFKGQDYSIDVDIFCVTSATFRSIYCEDNNEIEFQGNYTVDSFSEFINAVHRKPFKITISNADDILNLAREWKVDGLESEALSYVQSHPVPKYLIRKISDVHSRGMPINNIESEILKNFNNVLIEDSFYDLPADLLKKIMKNAFDGIKSYSFEPNLIAQAISRLSLKYGSSFSSYFSRIKFEGLTVDTIMNILSNPLFDIDEMSPQIITFLDILIKQYKDLENKNEKIVSSHNSKIFDIKTQIANENKKKALLKEQKKKEEKTLKASQKDHVENNSTPSDNSNENKQAKKSNYYPKKNNQKKNSQFAPYIPKNT